MITSRRNSSGRRGFIKNLTATVATGMVLPSTELFATTEASLAEFESTTFVRNDEQYWELVKKQFAIPDDMLMVNSANLCPSPYVVSRKVAQFAEDLQRDVSFQNRAKYAEIRKQTIAKLAEFVGASDSELGITRNTTEGNNLIINGLDLGRGDEVLIWDQNHQSNREAWENRARRAGFSVRRFSVPDHPSTKNELVDTIESEISANTRLIAFSHISNVSGISMPAREICNLAQNRGILTLIDGAQALGFLDLDLHELGCDFYTASTHKWLMGPFENGLLYMKEEHIDRMWPDSITVGWTPEKSTANEKFCSLGQRNEATPAAISETLDFHNQIGRKNIEQRVRALNTYLKTELLERINAIDFVTPIEEQLSGGVTISKPPVDDTAKLFSDLYNNYGIAAAPTGGLRISPTICATIKDINRIVDAIEELIVG